MRPMSKEEVQGAATVIAVIAFFVVAWLGGFVAGLVAGAVAWPIAYNYFCMTKA